MANKGPRPAPSILKYVRGEDKKDRLNDKEPTPPMVTRKHTIPEELAGNDVALKKWTETTPMLIRMRVFTEADKGVWARYCLIYAEWLELVKQRQKGGNTLQTFERDPETGERRIKYVQTAPWVTEAHKKADLLLKIEREFGLTPSSRSTVKIHDSKSSDPLSSYLERRSNHQGA
mgnify:CR=1 FL=1